MSIEVDEDADDDDDDEAAAEDDEDDDTNPNKLTEEDKDTLLRRLRETGDENIGMAMVYSLAMQLKESLTELLVSKAAAKELEEQAQQLRIQEAELAKPKGTPVTKEGFLAWKKKFEVEMQQQRKRDMEEELKGLPL